MHFNPFGKTGLFVSKLCLGTMTFGGKGFWEVIGQQDQATAARLMDRCLDAGINFSDTANIYSLFRGNRLHIGVVYPKSKWDGASISIPISI